MTRCWHDDPSSRPSFGDICVSIEQIVDAAEHLPLPGQSHSPVAPAAAVTPDDQPSPTYSNFDFDSQEEEKEATPLYRNCVTARSLETSAMVD